MQFLKRQGHVEGEHNHREGPSGRPRGRPWQNGASTTRPPAPTSAHNQISSDAGSAANGPHCSSGPSTSHGRPSSPATATDEKPKGPLSTKPAASAAAVPSKYLAIDCEMVGVGPKGCISQLARCSVVSYDGDVVYDKFINPTMPVTDYRTRWSGIRHKDLVNAMPYPQARKEILRLLGGKVVVGHAIHNDFKVLGYSHPAALTRDTSRIPLLNQKAGFAAHQSASLKRLTKAIFNRDIQTGKKGHSSVEDARATMELYKVVEEEWERTLASKSHTT